MKLSVTLTITACLLAFLVCPVCADSSAAPSFPAQFSGTLCNHEGKPFPVGTVITAEVNGVTSTYTITEAGKIGGTGTFDDKFLISGAVAGSEITFKIAGTDSEIKHIYNPASSQEIQQIQLTFTIPLPDSTGGGGGGYTSGEIVIHPSAPTLPDTPDTPDSGDDILPPATDSLLPQPPSAAKTPYPLMISIIALIGTAFIAGRK